MKFTYSTVADLLLSISEDCNFFLLPRKYCIKLMVMNQAKRDKLTTFILGFIML